MTVRRLSPSLTLLIVTTLAGPGCNGLNVERESMIFSFPPERPEVRVLLVYEGLGVRGDKPEDLAEAKKQLTELFVGRQEFWLGGSEVPFRFSLREPRAGDDSPVLSVLRKYLAIDRAELFTSPDGRLGAYQTLAVRDPVKLVAELNVLITAELAKKAREELARPAAKPAASDADRATWGLIERACRGKFEWLRAEPGRFSLTVPASPEFSRRVKAWLLGLENLADLETAVRGGKGKLVESAEPFLTFLQTRARLGDLADTPWSFDQRKEQFTIALGYGGGEAIRVVPRPVPARKPGGQDKDLLAFARRLEIPFRENTEAAALVEDFLKGPRLGREK